MFASLIKTGVLGVILLLMPLSDARAESLGDALILAYRSSGLLEQNRALLRAADEDVAQAVSRLRPVIDYVINSNRAGGTIEVAPGITQSTYKTTSMVQLSASLVLYDFGRTRLGIDIAKENVLSLRDALRGVEQGVLLNAVRAYVNVQRDLSIQGLRENNVELITQQLRAANDRYELGEITRTDVAVAQARLAAAQSALAAASGSLEISREVYRAAIGQYPGKLGGLPAAPKTVDSLAGARALARQNHPDLAQAQHQVKVADLLAQVAEAGILPVLSGAASVGINQDGYDSGSIGVTLSGPIYHGGNLASAQRKAAAQRDAARSGLHLASLRVDQNVATTWAQLSIANAGLAASEQQIRAARVAFRGMQEEAKLGSRTTLDVLDAEQALLDAESARISAQSDRYFATYNLLSAMGLLTVEHLRLGIATYDPSVYYNAVKAGPTYNVSPQGQRLDSLLESIGKK